MPIKHAAYKALRQTKKRTIKNRHVKDEIKDLKKKIRKLLEEKKVDEAKKLVAQFQKIVDKAAKVQILTKNKANRLKSRLMALIRRSAG